MVSRIVKDLFKIRKLVLSVAIFTGTILASVIGSAVYPVDPLKILQRILYSFYKPRKSFRFHVCGYYD